MDESSPPTAAYVGKDDQLFVLTSTLFSNLSFTLSARLLMPDGTIVPNQWTRVVAGQRNATYTPIPLPECFILAISLTANTDSTMRGCFGQIIISRGQPNIGVISQVLASGFCCSTLAISWPSGVNTNNVDCAGNIRNITGTTPAAGAEISESVPANARWLLISIRLLLTTTATAGNRQIVIRITDGVTIFYEGEAASAMPPSTALAAVFAAGGVSKAAALVVSTNPLPSPLILNQAWQIKTLTGSIAAGDQYSAPQYAVEEWFTP